MDEVDLNGILFVVFVVVILSLVKYFYEKHRSQNMEPIARSLGFLFENKSSNSIKEKYDEFHLFSRGYGELIRNRMWGERDGVGVSIFGFEYTQSGESSSTYTQTVVAFERSDLILTDFEMQPETIFHKIAQKFGYQDIDFSSHHVFSKKYLLRGNSDAEIRKLFLPNLLDHLSQLEKISLECKNNILICYIDSQRSKPSEIKMFLGQAEKIQKIIFQNSDNQRELKHGDKFTANKADQRG